MPRPTYAQLASGSATVVLTTLAALLLSGTSAVVPVAVTAVAALALGVLVAVLLPHWGSGARRHRADVSPALPRQRTASAPEANRSVHSLHN